MNKFGFKFVFVALMIAVTFITSCNFGGLRSGGNDNFNGSNYGQPQVPPPGPGGPSDIGGKSDIAGEDEGGLPEDPSLGVDSTGQMTEAQAALVRAVNKVGGQSVSGQYDPRICAQTEPYAQRMARQNGQDGHAGLQQRTNAIGGHEQSEITAETYPNEGGGLQGQADSCVEGWMGSPGHRRSLMGSFDRFCYSMEKGTSGRYYCVGLFANGGSVGSGGGNVGGGDQQESPQPRSKPGQRLRRFFGHR